MSLLLVGCGGGEGTTVNPTTANEVGSTAPAGTSGTPTTATATLTWVAPTQNTNSTPLTNLAGYNIYYGTDSSALTATIHVANPAALGYVVSGLATRTTWYFAVTSYTTTGEESAPSAIMSKTT